MDAILHLRYEKTKSVMLVDKDQKVHYLDLDRYETFVVSNSETMETTTYPNRKSMETSTINLVDVTRLGFVPKQGIAKRFIDF